MVKLVDYDYKIYGNLDSKAILEKIEYCGRTCYKSVNKKGFEDTKRFVGNLIKNGHTSVLEHELITVEFTADIGFYKDLTRHRVGTAFSIESTRWCNYSKDKFGSELQVMRPFWNYNDSWELWFGELNGIEHTYRLMAEKGATNDQLRMLLPHSTKATIMMSANLREWRHILKIRTEKAVHPSISGLLSCLLDEFHEKLPVLFDDIQSEVLDTDFYKQIKANLGGEI